MPLYMDFHQFDHVTIEDVKTAHIADQAVQDQYGVRYLQFWVNEKAGTVFCLTEGPDKESCELVHRIAHGNTACALVEVEPGFYKMMMGESHRVDHGLVHKDDGSIDLGYRTILCVRPGLDKTQKDFSKHDAEIKKLVIGKIDFFQGRHIRWEDDAVVGAFNDSTDAIHCALALHKISQESKIRLRTGISTDQPLTKEGDFFSRAIQRANHLSLAAQEGQILVNDLTQRLGNEDLLKIKADSVHLIDQHDLKLLSDFFSATEARIADETLTIEELCQKVGMSRPQLYRKITTLSGRAPNDLVRDIRIEKGLSLLKRRKGNVSQVAMEVGYSNPSYFTKCFSDKYGITPSKFLQQASL